MTRIRRGAAACWKGVGKCWSASCHVLLFLLNPSDPHLVSGFQKGVALGSWLAELVLLQPLGLLYVRPDLSCFRKLLPLRLPPA